MSSFCGAVLEPSAGDRDVFLAARRFGGSILSRSYHGSRYAVGAARVEAAYQSNIRSSKHQPRYFSD
jgi:hypothetical protein